MKFSMLPLPLGLFKCIPNFCVIIIQRREPNCYDCLKNTVGNALFLRLAIQFLVDFMMDISKIYILKSVYMTMVFIQVDKKAKM